LNIFILIESFTEKESIGNIPCPYWTIELVNNIEKGIKPFANIVTKIKWGPESGIIPIRTLNIKTSQTYCVVNDSKFK